MPTFKPQRLEDFVGSIFVGLGCEREEARQIARSLVATNLAGHDSHGVIRVPRYAAWLKDGTIVANQTVAILIDAPAFAVIDGRFGFGQSVARRAVEIGVAKCRQSGIAAIALRNSGHLGRVGEWAEMAATAGLVSIHFVNAAGGVLVAPFGAVERRFSTAPFCVGVPRPGRTPILLDFATSMVAEGKCQVASQGGKPLPPDVLIGPDGDFSNDPRLIYGEGPTTGARSVEEGKGAIRAFGEHKGSGLALMCELLGGSLTGTGATEPGRRFANGMFSIYVDPTRIDPENFFPADVARYVDWLKRARPVSPGGEVLTPGEPEELTRTRRRAEGIPIPEDTWKSIVATARSAGVGDDLIAAARAG